MKLTFPVTLLNPMTKEDQVEFKQTFIQSWHVRKVIAEYYEREVQMLLMEDEKRSMVNCPNYLVAAADNRGERRGMNKMIKLLKEGIPKDGR